MRLRIGSSAEERRALWRRQLEENPGATLEGHRKLWERGSGGGARRVSVATMSRAIRRLGWTYKKRRPSHRAGRGSPSPLARAGSTPRPGAARVRGDAAKLAPRTSGSPRSAGEGAQRRACLRESAEEPGEEHDDTLGEHGIRWDGVLLHGGRRGWHAQGGVRGVCRGSLGPVAVARAGGRGTRQPLRPQGGTGAQDR